MIYVILSSAFKSEDNEDEFIKLIKIGYTEDSHKDCRYYSYKIHNPSSRVLFEIPGCSLEIETLLHSYFSQYRYDKFGKEWYYWNDEIIQFFKINKTENDLVSIIDSDLKKGCKKQRFKEFSKYAHEIIDSCLNYRMRQSKDYTISQALKDKESCFNELNKSDLILKAGVYKFILGYFNIKEEDYNQYKNSLLESDLVNKFMVSFNNLTTFYDRMRLICVTNLTDQDRDLILEQVPLIYKNYYNYFGPSQLKANGYNITDLKKLLLSDKVEKDNNLSDIITKSFSIGDRIPLSEIKDRLRKIYNNLSGYSKSPKASDLEKYFELKSVKVLNKETGTRDNGYEILNKRKAL